MKTVLVIEIFVLLIISSIARADGPPSGWEVCRLFTNTYDQPACIDNAEHFKHMAAPYDTATTEAQAIELYEWASTVHDGVEGDRALSPCTARGVGGPLLPEELLAQCEELPTPTSTGSVAVTPVIGTPHPGTPPPPTPTVGEPVEPTPTSTATWTETPSPTPTVSPTDAPTVLTPTIGEPAVSIVYFLPMVQGGE